MDPLSRRSSRGSLYDHITIHNRDVPPLVSLLTAEESPKTSSHDSGGPRLLPPSLAVRLEVGVRPLHRAQLPVALGVLDDRRVAEVVLVPGLDAERSLRAHAPHRLPDIYRGDVLQPGQADVQGAERA